MAPVRARSWKRTTGGSPQTINCAGGLRFHLMDGLRFPARPFVALCRAVSPAALLGDRQDGIPSPERVLDALLGVRVRQPLAVHDKQVLMAARPDFRSEERRVGKEG